MTEIEWVGIINFKSENGQCWTNTTTNLKYFDGYSAKRSLKAKNIEVILNIVGSARGVVLFEARIIDVVNKNEQKRFLAKTPTTIYRNVLCFLDIKVKGQLNGYRFFGFYTKDYKTCLEQNCTVENQDDKYCGDIDGDIAFPITPTHTRQSSWSGIKCYGQKTDNPNFLKDFGKKSFCYPLGYEAVRYVKSENTDVELHLKIEEKDNKPFFKSFTTKEPVFELSSDKLNVLLKDTFSKLSIQPKRKWTGFEYFGLDRPELLQLYVTESKSLPKNKDPREENQNTMCSVLNCARNIRKRNAGETGSLCAKAAKSRNEKIHKLVEYVSFGDITSFINYVMTEFPEVVDDAMENNDLYCNHVIKNLKIKRLPVTLETKETACIMMGRSDLSQRSYKNLKKILQNNNVTLPTYDQVRSYCKAINVGVIEKIICNAECGCMGYKCGLKETLQLVVSTHELFSCYEFFTEGQQQRISTFLKSKDSDLYGNFDPSQRTLLIRETGDNFRASSRFPTEQISFSVMNNKLFLNSPYGQFICNLWRGSEDRRTLEIHAKCHYNELEELVRNGIVLTVNSAEVKFNVLVFFVADLSFTKEILGRCSCTHSYGCTQCQLKSQSWASMNKQEGTKHSLSKLIQLGNNAIQQLGVEPEKNSSKFKKFTQANFGQWNTVLFSGSILEMIPPCGLHLILAHHRYLWKFLHNVISKRSQEPLLPTALRKIGCTYLAFQIDSYFKSKKKHYDGSETLRMIGNDCKLMEDNIDSFLDVFVSAQGDDWQSEKSDKIRQVMKIYKLFADLARDIRSIHPDKDRIETFGNRVEKFFQIFASNASGNSVNAMPYLHYLRNHVPDLIKLYADHFGMGYGYFSTNGGEHLNKCIKQYEISETNLDKERFQTIIHLMRSKQFHFTKAILPSQRVIKCSACNQEGHNKKNKSCPLHPSHPTIVFEDSDNED